MVNNDLILHRNTLRKMFAYEVEGNVVTLIDFYEEIQFHLRHEHGKGRWEQANDFRKQTEEM